MRPVFRCVLVPMLLTAFLVLVSVALAAEGLRVQPASARLLQVKVVNPSQLNLQSRTKALTEILSAQKLAPDARKRILSLYNNLPGDLQADLLTLMDWRYAEAALTPDRYILDASLVRWRERLLLYNITHLWPDQGSPNNWAYIFGNGFNSDCVAYFDGAAVESYYLGINTEFFPNSIAFRVPVGATRGVDHQVKVHNNVTAKETTTVDYRIVAPRSYRGYRGWQFSNFGNPTIPWAAYRHYFGASTVEYANGTHRPAAQAYYDTAYKGAGAGGNCFGMSVSSLREKNYERYTFQEPWFVANPQTYLWWYPWQTETRQTVQESQGGWYTNETLAAYVNARDNQTPRDAFNRVVSLLSHPTNKPVLIFWWPGAGHAVVPYATNIVGDDRQIMVWDNNNPYRENETGSVDPNVFHVAWAANTANYGGPKTVQCLSYDECTPPVPHLPGAQFGGPGSNLVIAVLDEGTRSSQITDEDGRFFYNPDGSINEDPNTRIPFSAKLDPLVAELPTIRELLLKPAEFLEALVPKSSPDMYVFGSAGGKTLTFDLLAPQDDLGFRFFQNGLVTTLQGTGAGKVRMNNLLRPNRSLEVLNTTQLQPISSQIIRSFPNFDRSFLLHNLRNVGGATLRLAPAQNGDSLQVLGSPALLFNLDVSGPLGQGMQEVGFTNIGLAANALAVVAPTNWGALGTSNLRLQLRNKQTNQVLQTRNIGRIIR